MRHLTATGILVIACTFGQIASAKDASLDLPYQQRSVDGEYTVHLSPPTPAVPNGLAVCRRTATGQALWMAEVYSPRTAVSLDGKAFAVWGGPLPGDAKEPYTQAGASVYYSGKLIKSFSVDDLFKLTKGGGKPKLVPRAEGPQDWLARVGEFKADAETFTLDLASGSRLELNARTGEATGTPVGDPAGSPGYAAARSGPDVKRVTDVLAAKVYQAVASASNTQSNVIYSPPVTFRSFMILSGLADGETRKSLNNLLGIAADAEARPATEVVRDWKSGIRSPGWSEATGLWVSQSVKAKEGAFTRLKELAVATETFDPTKGEKLSSDVGAWLKDRLKGSEEVGPLDIPADSLFVLASAATFKARWKVVFEEDSKITFNLPDGKTEKVSAVRGSQTIRVLAKKGGIVVGSVPFESERSDFVVLMPEDPKGTLQAVNEVMNDPSRLERVLAELDLQKPVLHDVLLPTLKTKQVLDFSKHATTLELKPLFDPAQTSFGELWSMKPGGPIRFNTRQTVEFKLDKFGVTAAAVQISDATSIGSSPIFQVNRPFVFIIRDRVTGMPLFVGRINDPR